MRLLPSRNDSRFLFNWREQASLTTPALSSTFFAHYSIRSEMSAISLS
jgi:hypothetical protein